MTYLDKVWRLSLFYSTAPAGVAVLNHEMKFFLNVIAGAPPGADLADYIVEQRSASSTDLADYMATYELPFILANYAATDTFDRMELWAADVGSDNFDFYSSLSLSDPGTGGGLAIALHQTTITFRAQNGKTGRAQLMEDISTSLNRVSFTSASVAQQDLAAFIQSVDSARLTKDFSYFISTIFVNGSNSDALEKKRFR